MHDPNSSHTPAAQKAGQELFPSIKTTQPLDLFFFFFFFFFAASVLQIFWPRELPTSGSGVARGFPNMLPWERERDVSGGLEKSMAFWVSKGCVFEFDDVGGSSAYIVGITSGVG